MPIVAAAPFELVCMDILQLGMTPRGKKYLLVCVDHFSKFVVAEPLVSKSAEEVATVLLNRLVLVHGAPQRIHSDMGREFVNKIIAHLVKLLGTEQSTTSGYNPRANGAAERVNREIIGMLRRSCIVPQDWDERVQFVIFAYNTTSHASTGEAPYFIIHGRDANFPSSIDPQLVPKMYADAHSFIEMISENVNEVVCRVRDNLEKARARYKRYYDSAKKVSSEKYHVGQRVMVLNPQPNSSQTRKMDWHFYGPFRIKEIEGSNARVQPLDKPHAKTELVPLDRLGSIPEECNLEWEGKEPRKRLLRAPAEHIGGGTDGNSRQICIDGFRNPAETPSSNRITVTNNTTTSPLRTEIAFQTSGQFRDTTREMPVQSKIFDCQYLVFISSDLNQYCIVDGSSHVSEVYSGIWSLETLFTNAEFTPSLKEILLFLPQVDGGEYPESVKAILLHAAKFPMTRFLIVPPPPVKSGEYEQTIDLFIELFTSGEFPHIVRLENRLKTIYSLGWSPSGDALNNYHSKGGKWTKGSAEDLYKFISNAMGVKWPFTMDYQQKKEATRLATQLQKKMKEGKQPSTVINPMQPGKKERPQLRPRVKAPEVSVHRQITTTRVTKQKAGSRVDGRSNGKRDPGPYPYDRKPLASTGRSGPRTPDSHCLLPDPH